MIRVFDHCAAGTGLTLEFFFQGILLHSNGEVRPASLERGGQERQRAPRFRGFGALPRPQRSLQPEQPH
jgi:hypothetical protein